MDDGRRLGEQLAECLRVELAAQAVSQADLAREMGLTPKHVNHMVNGKSGALAMYELRRLHPRVPMGRETRAGRR